MVEKATQLFVILTIFLLVFRSIQSIPSNKYQHYNTDHSQQQQQRRQAPEKVQAAQPVHNASSPHQSQQNAPGIQARTSKLQGVRRRRPKAGIWPCPAHFSNSRFRYCFNRFFELNFSIKWFYEFGKKKQFIFTIFYIFYLWLIQKNRFSISNIFQILLGFNFFI